MEQYLKLELTKNFKVIRDLELMPTMLGQGTLPFFLLRLVERGKLTHSSFVLDFEQIGPPSSFNASTDLSRYGRELVSRTGSDFLRIRIGRS